MATPPAAAAAKKGSDSNLARLDSFGGASYANGSSAVHMYAAAYSSSISGANGGLTAVNGGGANSALNGSGLNGSLNGSAGLAGPYSPKEHRGGATPRSVGLDFLGAWGLHALKAGERKGGFKLAAPQYAATLTAVLALLLHAVPQVRHCRRRCCGCCCCWVCAWLTAWQRSA
jgi:hypothetical protein